jgi:hypothetical protein
MFELPPIPPVVSFALFGAKAVEVSALLTRGLTRAKTYHDKCDLIAAAYQDKLKWLKRLALFRPRLMITTAGFLMLITIWFFLIIYSYYSPSSAIAQKIAVTYPYSIGISATALTIGALIIFFTSFSFARIYNIFRLILPQPEQRLASRVDRETEGYFYIDDERGDRIVPLIVESVLANPSWYDAAEVFTPSPSDEVASAEYANFVFFGELVEAKAGGGKPMERWGWITHVYRNKPDLFNPTRLKQLTEDRKFAATLVNEMAKFSETREPFVNGLYAVLDFNVAMLGKHYNHDARKIGQPNLIGRLLIRAKLQSMFELVEKRTMKFETYKKRSGNRLVLIKLMAIRRIWKVPLEELEFPFSTWQCVFLLRSRIISTDLEKFSTDDSDFAWFRDAALRNLSALVKNHLDRLNEEEKKKMTEILKSEIEPSSAMILTDTFLWTIGTECCLYNNCGELRNEKGKLCPFSQLEICKPSEGKKLFTYERPNFVLK